MHALTCCLLAAAGASAIAQIVAFPGAEGDGRFATGGRGGEVIHVTNLNAEGPGSLANAMSQGDRIIVFDVSGVIDITRRKKNKTEGGSLKIEQPNITIAGQTAPGEGICIKGGDITIAASNVILRHLRSRRGWICEGDSGDAITVKPRAVGIATEASQSPGRDPAHFDKTLQKKKARGKEVQVYADLDNILIDHCSASWATDENLTMTHAGHATMQWCIAAEGCDYVNPKQTPPNHSEGSLWGSSATDGRSTLHHTLYAHNRLRNPRTVGGSDTPPVLTFYNNIVYNWSEYPSHTGSEVVHLLWLNSFYKPGPSTAAEIRRSAFQFHGSPFSQVFASGNVIDGFEAGTRDNKLAIGWDEKKFKKATGAEKAEMIAATPWIALPAMQSAREAYDSVLDEAGATLPARDAVDSRITRSVREGSGKVVEKETDLSEKERWPEYHSLPPPADHDGDGLPDVWQQQFGVHGANALTHGYANIEHWFNNTDPTGSSVPIVFVRASVSRASAQQDGEWLIERTGDTTKELSVNCISNDALMSVIVQSGQRAVRVPLKARPAQSEKIITLTLQPGAGYHIGCPHQSLIVIQP